MENLRDRLESSETTRQAQETLLRKLNAKLAQAAEYLRQLPFSEDPARIGPAPVSKPAAASRPVPRRRAASKPKHGAPA